MSKGRHTHVWKSPWIGRHEVHGHLHHGIHDGALPVRAGEHGLVRTSGDLDWGLRSGSVDMLGTSWTIRGGRVGCISELGRRGAWDIRLMLGRSSRVCLARIANGIL